MSRETKLGINTIDAAIEAGVKFLLFTSVGGLTDEYCGIAYWNTKIDIGRYLKKTAPARGLKYAILKPWWAASRKFSSRAQCSLESFDLDCF